MPGIANILIFILIIILLLIIFLTCIYALPIIFISRFHTVSNILTLNVCLISCLGSLYWLIHFLIYILFPNQMKVCLISCTIIPYFQTVIHCLMIYALLMITINRFFLVIYPYKILFKRRKWSFFCIIFQWISAIILPLPFFLQSTKVNIDMISLWLRIYQLLVIVIFPSLLNGLLNTFILMKVRLSIRRLGKEIKKPHLNRLSIKCLNSRDVCLLKHMLFIHIVFLLGWLPINLLWIIQIYIQISFTLYLTMQVLPAITLFINILDLYIFNHEVRQYLQQQFLISM